MNYWRVTAISPRGRVYRAYNIEASSEEIAINHARRAFRRARHRDPDLYRFDAMEWERPPERRREFGWVKPIGVYEKEEA